MVNSGPGINALCFGFLALTCIKLVSTGSNISSRVPSLVDRVFAVHAGSRGFDFHRWHMYERFSDPINQDICALRWKKCYQSGGRWLQRH